jgi:hypothetical protein
MAQANHTSGRKTAPDYLSKISIQAVMEVVLDHAAPPLNTACLQAFLDVLASRFVQQDILLVLEGALRRSR